MSGVDRTEFLRQPFLLPPDVLLFPVEELAAHVREHLECGEDDYAVTRPGMRSFSRIVDRETAALLEEFRQPSPLAEAILRYSRRNGLDPHDLLERAFPVLEAFSAALFLVPANSPLAEGVTASFAPGQLVSGYEVRRLVQVLEDTELYQAQAPGGRVVALKITRPAPPVALLLAVQREAAILEHLDGICSPHLIEVGSFRERAFIASSWLSGIPISRRAQELRTAASPPWRQQLHRLCCRLIGAYCALHERGVVHADIHPHNILVNGDDEVFVLDYGISRFLHRPELDHSQRAGLAWFVEPEVVAPVLQGKAPPPASSAGEQYAIAALIYFLICGEHYLTASPERELLYRQVLEVAPPPFTRRGFESWTEIEAVLSRALSKTPRDRYGSLAEFHDAFSRAQPPGAEQDPARVRDRGRRREWVEDIVSHAVTSSFRYVDLFPQRPAASIYFGASGLAWFLYRAAQVREDPQLLAAADLWSRQVLDRLDNPGSFDAPQMRLTREQEGGTSLYHGRCGAHYISALVSQSRGDLSSTKQQVYRFIETSQAVNNVAELTFGRAGVLVAGSLLLEVLSWSKRLDVDPLVTYLQEEGSRLGASIQGLPLIGEQSQLAHLGIAHGWAGVLYAQLMVHKALDFPPPATIHDRLQQLAGKAEPHGRGISWIGTLQHPGQTAETPSHAPGWCSGSGGYLFLWLLAAEVLREERYLEVAEKAAWHTWEHPDRHPNLCCGLAGRAFALLRYYRYTGDREWLFRARQLADFAFAAFDREFVVDPRTFSLYRGALGPALLSIELECPERSTMPVFESEGWP
jgi:eukaryotic-like serine/threonine-protein kinase